MSIMSLKIVGSTEMTVTLSIYPKKKKNQQPKNQKKSLSK